MSGRSAFIYFVVIYADYLYFAIYAYIYILIEHIEDAFIRPDQLCNLMISFLFLVLGQYQEHFYHSSGYNVQMVLPGFKKKTAKITNMLLKNYPDS